MDPIRMLQEPLCSFNDLLLLRRGADSDYVAHAERLAHLLQQIVLLLFGKCSICIQTFIFCREAI